MQMPLQVSSQRREERKFSYHNPSLSSQKTPQKTKICLLDFISMLAFAECIFSNNVPITFHGRGRPSGRKRDSEWMFWWGKWERRISRYFPLISLEDYLWFCLAGGLLLWLWERWVMFLSSTLEWKERTLLMREVVSSNPDGLPKCLYLVIEKNLPRASAFNRVQSRGSGVPLSESTAKIIQQWLIAQLSKCGLRDPMGKVCLYVWKRRRKSLSFWWWIRSLTYMPGAQFGKHTMSFMQQHLGNTLQQLLI